jgi:type IV pilus assembly protein PilQ
MMKKATAFWLVFVTSLVFTWAGSAQPSEPAQARLDASYSARIEAIVPEVTPDRTRVELHCNAPLLYTSYAPDDHSLVLEIRDVDTQALPPVTLVEGDVVGEVHVNTEALSKSSSMTHIEFTGVNALRHSLRSQGTHLVVEFFPSPRASLAVEPAPEPEIEEERLRVPAPVPAPAPAEPAVEASPAASLLGVDPVAAEGQARILLRGDGRFHYQAFTLESPDRLVLDLVGVRNHIGNLRLPVDAAPVRRARVSQFKDEPQEVSRVVLDLTEPATYRVIEGANSLEVILAPAAPDQGVAPEGFQAWAPVSDAPPPLEPEPVVTAATVPEPAATDEPPQPVAERPTEALMAGEAEVPLSLPEMGVDPIVESDYVLFEQDTPAPPQGQVDGPLSYFETKTISGEPAVYTGEKISVNFVEADLKNVFLFFADFIGLNIVIDPEVRGSLTMRLNQVPWDQAFDVILRHQGLEKVVEGNVVRIATTEKLRQEASQRRALKRAQEEEVDAITFTKVLSYAKVNDVMQLLQQAGTGGVKSDRAYVAKDERTNTLIITDLPSKREAYEKLIEVLDTRTEQVMIEARIVETDRNYEQDLGVEWSFFAAADKSLGTDTGLDFPNDASLSYDVSTPAAATAGALGISLGNVLDSVTLDLTLQAFENDGKVRILSSPKVATQNNQTATIEQGTQIPVVTTTAVEINVQYISASLKLEVTPQITADDTIIMDIDVENNSPDFVNRVGDVPPIITEQAKTQILVRNGSTAVIGGIFKLNESFTESGVPGLMKIPVLGWLFKNRAISKQNTELLVFITPRILDADL